MESDVPLILTAAGEAALRRREGMRRQAIEGNPLDAKQVAMFEMFEREAWPHERRRAYILQRVMVAAAE